MLHNFQKWGLAHTGPKQTASLLVECAQAQPASIARRQAEPLGQKPRFQGRGSVRPRARRCPIWPIFPCWAWATAALCATLSRDTGERAQQTSQLLIPTEKRLPVRHRCRRLRLALQFEVVQPFQHVLWFHPNSREHQTKDQREEKDGRDEHGQMPGAALARSYESRLVAEPVEYRRAAPEYAGCRPDGQGLAV